MTTREYVIKWHRGDKSTGVGEVVERWARVLSLAFIPIVLGVVGHLASQRVARQQVDIEYVKTALSVLQSEYADERLRRWAVGVINRFSEVRLDTSPELQSALETGEIVLPTNGDFALHRNRPAHVCVWLALMQLEELPPSVTFSAAGDLHVSNLRFWQAADTGHVRALSLASQLVDFATFQSGASVKISKLNASSRLAEVLKNGTSTLRFLGDTAGDVMVFPGDKK